MLLFYLQVKNTPILPSLQDLAANKDLIKTKKDFMRVSVEGWDCTRLSARLFKEFSARNNESLGCVNASACAIDANDNFAQGIIGWLFRLLRTPLRLQEYHR